MLKEALERRQNEEGVGVRRLATTLGLDAGRLRGLLERDNEPGLDKAYEIAQALGWELYLGPPREDHRPVDPQEFASVDRYDVQASAGPGAVAISEGEASPLAFRRDWLKRMGIAPSNAAVFEARGDSMFPLIHDGDLLLIDRADTMPTLRTGEERRPSPIYTFEQDGSLRLKRVERREQFIVLLSENYGDHPPEIVAGPQMEELRFIGQVHWWCRRAA
ncbi:MAG: S24 family peptidase [Paracoccaceae bacterium]